MTYRIVIEKKALKFLASVSKRDYLKLQEHINELAEDPTHLAALNYKALQIFTGIVLAITASYIQ